MNQQLFLQALCAALKGDMLSWEGEVSWQEWQELFQTAVQHSVLPMIYQSVYASDCYKQSEIPTDAILRGQVRGQVVSQVMKTNEFLKMYQALGETGIQPVVVKGIVCRSLYPHPDCRISGDEDLYVPRGHFEEYHQAMLDVGMEVAQWDREEADTLHEISFVKKGTALQVELHKTLFDENSEIFSVMNEQFADAFERSVEVEIEGTRIRTMEPGDHLLFLILHAFKHFVGSGFGLRQVCDMVMFANAYGRDIDWQRVLDGCRKVHGEVFAASLFEIGAQYLGFDEEKAGYPKQWKQNAVDPGDLLSDLLSAGIFGGSDMSRKHSSNITLTAVTEKQSGGGSGSAVLRTAFPPVSYLSGRYPYLKKYPFLLPVAWVDRIINYRKETKNTEKNNAADSIRIGNQRIELMKKYGILK